MKLYSDEDYSLSRETQKYSLELFCKIARFIGYLLKRATTWNDLKRPTTSKKQPETTWNDLQRVRNNLKRPETTYNEQETTWNDLQWARNNLKRPEVNKKRPETTYNKQETTWKDLQRTIYNFIEPLYLKNNQLEDSNVPNTQ